MRRSNKHCHELTNEELIMVQNKTFELFVLFSDICKKHNITFYLSYGSLLGAVRHGDFIPWDDDLDVCMTFDNIEKLKGVCERELPSGYFFQDYSTDSQYHKYFPKIIDTNCILEPYMESEFKMKCGVFIDIFPLVQRSNVFFKRNADVFFERLMIHSQWRNYIYPDTNVFNQSKKSKIIEFISNVLYGRFNERELCLKIQKSLKKHRYNEKCNYITVGSEDNHFLPKDYFNTLVYVDFRNTKAPAPNNWGEILKALYGDYMKLPNENDRKPHHLLSKIDIETLK